MHSLTATRPSTGSADTGVERPRIGVLGVMQRPLRRDAARHHRAPGGLRRTSSARALGEVADVRRRRPRSRIATTSSARCASFEHDGPRRPARRHAHLRPGDERRARAGRDAAAGLPRRTPSPSARSPSAWDMADLTYNQGIHGAQDTANALVRAGRPFGVVTGDWRSPVVRGRRRALGARGRGGHALARAEGRDLRLRDERHGRHPRRRAHAADARSARRSTRSRPAPSTAPPPRSTPSAWRSCSRTRTRRFEVDPRLTARGARGPRAHAARARADSRASGGYGAYSTHFGAIAEDGRFDAAAARRRVQPDGRGVRLRGRGRRGDRGADVRGADAARDDAVHRDVRDGLRARRVPDEPHGRGQLGARPRRPAGAADQAQPRHRRPRRPADVPLPVRDRARARSRRCSPCPTAASGSSSSEGEILDTEELPGSRCRTASSARRAACARAPTAGCAPAGRTTRCSTPATGPTTGALFCAEAGIELAIV